jgi:hypothetical protein
VFSVQVASGRPRPRPRRGPDQKRRRTGSRSRGDRAAGGRNRGSG